MEKRIILFILLSTLILFLYPFLIQKIGWIEPPEPPPVERPPQKPSEEESAGPVITRPAAPEQSERTLTVSTPLFEAALSNRGGVITSWRLKRYTQNGTASPIDLLASPAAAPFPLSTPSHPELANALYSVEGGDLVLNETTPAGEVQFSYQDPTTGARVHKRLTFSSENYLVRVEVGSAGIPDPLLLSLGTHFGMAETGQGQMIGFVGPETRLGEELIKDAPDKLTETKRHEGPVVWTALQDKYFVAALLPDASGAVTVSKTEDQRLTVGVELKPGRSSVRLYAGPKEYDRLRDLGVRLEQTIDFGWFIFGSWGMVRLIAEPLFYVLKVFYEYTHNYGAAIILVTVGLRALFIPLNHKSYKAMKVMQTLQPEVAALQKKYKDDKERLNRELIELYRKHKANPLGGCLPMLLQIPVFIALFNILYMTIELRQAPFIGWVTDLSSKDPYYVLPILMGITMVVQQKLQPSSPDPRQARIMMFMPVLFTFLFLSFPSGLVLYWFTSNLLTIAQQYVTMRFIEGGSPAAPETRSKKKLKTTDGA
jgi:YidC/Oxa1 family membrane protein insertase